MPFDDVFAQYWTQAQRDATKAEQAPLPTPCTPPAGFRQDAAGQWVPVVPSCSRRDVPPGFWSDSAA